MSKQMKWGLATLLLLLGIAAVFLFIDKDTETEPEMTLGQPTKDLLKKGVKLPQQAETPVAVEELPPVVPPNEHPSGPHQHEDDKVHNHSPIVSQTYTGPLTYHAELLETNPVKALRLQTEERGHWSAEWIPTFDPGDQEAAALARSRYLSEYYVSIGEGDTPASEKASREWNEIFDKLAEAPWNARKYDLMKLAWPAVDYEVLRHYDKNGVGKPSNFFLPFRDPHPLANTPANKVGNY